jgi:hypothetical protein
LKYKKENIHRTIGEEDIIKGDFSVPLSIIYRTNSAKLTGLTNLT